MPKHGFAELYPRICGAMHRWHGLGLATTGQMSQPSATQVPTMGPIEDVRPFTLLNSPFATTARVSTKAAVRAMERVIVTRIVEIVSLYY